MPVITIDVNPRGIDDEYLKCLNLCFGDWGDRRSYDWYFRRKTVYPDADLIVLKKNDHWAAGSAVTYAKVAFPNESEVTVGIMTGAWTLPPFRNQGYFAGIIEESLRLTAKKGGALLLGFAVDDRSSFRQLVRAGSVLFPNSYISSSTQTEYPETRSSLSPVKISREVIADLAARLSASGKGFSRFTYGSPQEFESQFIERPGATRVLVDDYNNCGIIERTAHTDVLQLYLAGSDDEFTTTEGIAGFLHNAAREGRKLFLCSSEPRVARLANKLGMEVRPAHLTVLVADESRLHDALGIPHTTATVDSSLLAHAESDWYLGNWKLQGGNRA